MKKTEACMLALFKIKNKSDDTSAKYYIYAFIPLLIKCIVCIYRKKS